MITLKTLELMLLLAETTDLEWNTRLKLRNYLDSLIKKQKELIENSKDEDWPPY